MTKDQQQREVAWKEYRAIVKPAEKAFNAIRDPAVEAYHAIVRPAQKALDAIEVQAHKVYHAIQEPAYGIYLAKIKEIAQQEKKLKVDKKKE